MFASDFLMELKNILFGVSQKPSLLWQIAPLIILWFILEIYFGKYKHEKLGWNTSLGNGITMFWVIISAFQTMFSSQQTMRLYWSLIFAMFLLAAYSIFIIVISFKHSIKDKFTYLLASPTPVYYFSIIALLLANQIVYADATGFMAIFTLFFLILIFFFILRLFIPAGEEPIEDTLDTKFDFDDKKSKKKQKDVLDDPFKMPSSDLETQLDSTFSSNSDPFSNDFASTSSEDDLLLKKNPLKPF